MCVWSRPDFVESRVCRLFGARPLLDHSKIEQKNALHRVIYTTKSFYRASSTISTGVKRIILARKKPQVDPFSRVIWFPCHKVQEGQIQSTTIMSWMNRVCLEIMSTVLQTKFTTSFPFMRTIVLLWHFAEDFPGGLRLYISNYSVASFTNMV